jgi:pyruvate formate lyase activating enzyme
MEQNKLKEAQYYEKREQGVVRCTLCPHECRIAPEKTGICKVRKNIKGELRAASYGRLTSLALDPVEKKPLRHFYPGSQILSAGSYGCNFHCGFCQNHTISMGLTNEPGEEAAAGGCHILTSEELARIALEAVEEGNIGLAYTYNEPVIGIEFVKDCAKMIRAQGQKNIMVSNGYVAQKPLLDVLPLIDAMNIDLKSFTEDFYQKIGGDLESVKQTIETVSGRCHLEVTTLIIGGENDSQREMEELSAWLAGVSREIPLHISRFFPAFYYSGREATPVETVYKLAETARQNLKYVYAGNC